MKFDLNTVKNALITTAVVLGTVYLMRRTSAGQSIVNKALAG